MSQCKITIFTLKRYIAGFILSSAPVNVLITFDTVNTHLQYTLSIQSSITLVYQLQFTLVSHHDVVTYGVVRSRVPYIYWDKFLAVTEI